MSISPTVQDIGKYAAGEIPPAVQHQYLDTAGDPLDISGFTATAFIESSPTNTGLGDGSISIVDAPNGIVQYVWDEDDMANPGGYRLQLWVENGAGTQRYASDIFSYQVYDGVGPTS